MSFETEKKAQAHCDKVLVILGDNWKGRVWNNLGWHCSWQWGSVALYYSTNSGGYYHTLIGHPGSGSGHADLNMDVPPGITYTDPKEAVMKACDSALQVIASTWAPIHTSVAQVRYSL
jgi:hypothetical protein